MSRLRVALAKGRLYEPALERFRAAGIEPAADAGRRLLIPSSDPAIEERSMVETWPISTAVISYITSMGKERNTGPVGAALQSWKARRTRVGIWSARVISLAHFTAGADYTESDLPAIGYEDLSEHAAALNGAGFDAELAA